MVSRGLSPSISTGLSRDVGSAAGGAAAVPLFFLDTYTGATAAYSVYKLKSDATRCKRVRRSSDNEELDIGFSGTGIDTTTLLSFVGAGDGFTVTDYDQTGNGNDATQSTALLQPYLVKSGVYLGYQEGSNRCMSFPSGVFTGATAATLIAVFSQVAVGIGRRGCYRISAISSAGTANHHPWDDANAYDSFCSSSRLLFSGYGIVAGMRVHAALHLGTQLRLRVGGAVVDTQASTFATPTTRKYPDDKASDYGTINHKALIIYPSDQSTSIAAMEADLATACEVTLP